jgi:predicted DNA-binding transcriptional regulator AlpA
MSARLEKKIHPRSIAGFCDRYGIARSTFYNMRAAGAAPDLLRIGNQVRITIEAERAWQERHTQRAPVAA